MTDSEEYRCWLAANPLQPRRWHLMNNWGNYGAYGWKWGIWRIAGDRVGDLEERLIRVQIGQWAFCFRRVVRVKRSK